MFPNEPSDSFHRCVPKKMTFSFASINEAIHAGRFYGYDFGEKDVPKDFKSFVDKRDARIKQLNSVYETNWEKEGIDLMHGTATFVGPHELEIKPNDGGESYKITAPHITIAVGGHPTKPEGIKGSQYGITSDEYFSIQYLPKKMVFVGGGYIAVELAGVMNAIGVETHLFIRGNTFLRKFDPMIQDALTKHYEDIGVHVHRKHPGIKEVIQLKAAKDEHDPREKELKLIMEDGSEMITNELLWAIGRAPEIEGLGLDKAGVELGKTGHIVVDKYQNTNVEGIYALGDVTGQAELTPVAIAAGRTLGNRLFSGNPEFKDAALDYDRIPTVVFSHPPLGTTGLTQPEAEERYGKENVRVYTTKFAGMYYDVFSKEEKAKQINAFKMVCKGDNEEVVGLHLLGDGCDEMMQGFGVAVKMGATRKDFQDTINIHPTSSEEVTSL